METIFFDKINEIKKEKEFLEKKLNVSISINGKKVAISGNPMEEYEAMLVLDAINFGFSAQTAYLVKDEDFIFRKINIKNCTRRKNLADVKARLIGTHGKTKKTIEQIAECKIIIKGNEVGIICIAEDIDKITTGITNLLKGTKQSNIYKYLERVNAGKKFLKRQS